MRVTFVDLDRDTLYLLPPSIQEWLPEKQLARFVVDIVEKYREIAKKRVSLVEYQP
jgi:hypothetical protein